MFSTAFRSLGDLLASVALDVNVSRSHAPAVHSVAVRTCGDGVEVNSLWKGYGDDESHRRRFFESVDMQFDQSCVRPEL